MTRNFKTAGITFVVFAALFSIACGGAPSGSARELSPPTGQGPATVNVINSSNEAIHYIHMSPSAQDTWGSDLLGANVLMPGQSILLTGVGQGNWDIRLVDGSGNVKEYYGEWVAAGGAYELIVDSYNWQMN